MDPSTFSEERFRPSLEERLESIISGAALMADSSCTRDDRRERIVAECNAVRQALQDLLSEYMGNVSSFCSVLFCFCGFSSVRSSKTGESKLRVLKLVCSTPKLDSSTNQESWKVYQKASLEAESNIGLNHLWYLKLISVLLSSWYCF